MPSQSSNGTSVANFRLPALCECAGVTHKAVRTAKQKMGNNFRGMSSPRERVSGFLVIWKVAKTKEVFWWSRWDCLSPLEENRRKTAKFQSLLPLTDFPNVL
jgi:hypothetical protein